MTRVSRVIAILALLALILAMIGALAGPGQAASPSLSVTPSMNLADGQQVTVTGTGLGVTGLVAVVECGNADSNGTPLPGNAASAADCYGAESVGTQTILVTVANDSATTPYTVRTGGIGANGRKCISGGNFDCVIAMADVATQGNVLRIAASISFGGGVTTTTSPASTTSTTTGSTSTTRTTTPATSSPPAAVPVSPPSTTAPATPGAPSDPVPASTTRPDGTLPLTGLPPSIWLTIGVALCLLDVGYLLWSATRPPRRRGTA